MRRAIVVAVGLALAWPAAANPIDLYGMGGRGPAMAGAQTAASDDLGANYYNPAALLRLHDLTIDVGYQAALPRLALNHEDTGVDSARGLTLGLGLPGHLGPFAVVVGAALYIPDQHLTRVRFLQPGQPRFALYDNRAQTLFLAANLAARLAPRLWLGGGLGFMANSQGGITLAGRLGYPDPNDSDLDLAIGVDIPPTQYPQLGLLYAATDWLDLGLSYRGGFSLAVGLSVAVNADIGAGGRPPIVKDGSLLLTSLAHDLFQPAQWSAGLDARLTSRLTLAFDLALHRWSTFANPASRITTKLDAGQFNDLIHIPPTTDLPAPYFHDILVPRLGLEYRLDHRARRDVDLRAGYAYEPSPTPEQVGASNFVDNDKHTFATGVGVTLRRWSAVLTRPLRLDAYLTWTYLPGRDTHKLSPIDPVGDYHADGEVVAAGLWSSWSF